MRFVMYIQFSHTWSLVCICIYFDNPINHILVWVILAFIWGVWRLHQGPDPTLARCHQTVLWFPPPNFLCLVELLPFPQCWPLPCLTQPWSHPLVEFGTIAVFHHLIPWWVSHGGCCPKFRLALLWNLAKYSCQSANVLWTGLSGCGGGVAMWCPGGGMSSSDSVVGSIVSACRGMRWVGSGSRSSSSLLEMLWCSTSQTVSSLVGHPSGHGPDTTVGFPPIRFRYCEM